MLDLLQRGSGLVAADAFARRRREATPDSPRATVAASLRRARRVVTLAAAFGDLGGNWPLERVTSTLSSRAAHALGVATAHLLRADGLARDVAVLARGKLGARELNCSSDVDLFLLHDRADVAADTLARFARAIVDLMETRDGDGYVFRVDLRLRPDPQRRASSAARLDPAGVSTPTPLHSAGPGLLVLAGSRGRAPGLRQQTPRWNVSGP